MPHSTAFPEGSFDAVIVGARCAGASTALLLARGGARVLAIDRSAPGADALSTHALMRAGTMQLQRWGVLAGIEAAGTPRVTQATFHYAQQRVDVPIKAKTGVPALFAPRRMLLDRLLVEAAREAGATVLHRTHLVRLARRADGRVHGVDVLDAEGRPRRVESSIVVGADGLQSSVARFTSAPIYRQARHASGIMYAYWQNLEGVEGYHWHYGPGVTAGVIPTNEGLTCVFAAVPARRFRALLGRDVDAGYGQVIARASPDLVRALGRASRAGNFKGFQGHPGFFRQSWGPGWALVGDAGYFKDPITAHGITDALIHAELLARAVLRGGDAALARYQDERDALANPVFETTDALASFDWDLPQSQILHHALADGMAAETRAVSAFDEHGAALAR